MRGIWFRKFYNAIERIIRILEIVLSFILIIGVLGAGIIMVAKLYDMLSTSTFQSFQQFLDDALLYLIGLEVAMLLVKRDPRLVIEILTFAIARKMIVNMQAGTDFLFGALAILVLYVVKRYGISGMPLPKLFSSNRSRKPDKTSSAPPTGSAPPNQNAGL